MFKNYTFTFTDQSAEPIVMNLYSCVGSAECGRSLSPSSVPTRIKNPCKALLFMGNIYSIHIHIYCKTREIPIS